MKEIFEWERMMLNELPVEFLLEVIFRSAVMFIFLLVVIKLTGKRGVKQLSIFETVIIIALGSAAGDPMFYEDVGIIPALVVFFVVLVLYRLVTWLTGRFPWFERLIEGKTECLIQDGAFSFQKFDKESLAQDEFFTELRLKNVEHLGQVRNAYIETTGDISVFYFEDKDVKYGLPIRPDLFDAKTEHIITYDLYACSKCGITIQLDPGQHTCKSCGNKSWVKAINTRRIT